MDPKPNTQLILYADPNEGSLYRFTKTGLKHKSSGKFVHPLNGSTTPPNNNPIVLWAGEHAGTGWTMVPV